MRAKSLQVLTNELKARYPGIVIYGVGDDAHKTRLSDHNEDDTAGSRPAQTDADSIPEHRAIDAMLGASFSRAQASAVIQEILGTANNKKRLYYINFQNDQWSRSTGFIKHDNSDDPHPTHIHFSGWAAEDDNIIPWLTGGTEVLRADRGMGQNGQPPHDNVLYLQNLMNELIADNDPRLQDHPLVVDGNYGGNTAYWVSVLLTGGDGNTVDGNWFGNLTKMVNAKQANAEVATHNANMPHGGELPETVEMTIPAYTVPAQTVTVPIES